jgi:molybdate transport system permease protein
VAGIALLVAFGRRGLVGQSLADMGIQIAFTQIAVIMAQVFVASPYFVKSANSAFAADDRELEAAAAVDGVSPLSTFWRITPPLSASGALWRHRDDLGARRPTTGDLHRLRD